MRASKKKLQSAEKVRGGRSDLPIIFRNKADMLYTFHTRKLKEIN
jgi:hypothetical protein